MRPKASWAIDSEPIRARGMIVKYFMAKFSYNEEIYARSEGRYQFIKIPRESNTSSCLASPLSNTKVMTILLILSNLTLRT